MKSEMAERNSDHFTERMRGIATKALLALTITASRLGIEVYTDAQPANAAETGGYPYADLPCLSGDPNNPDSSYGKIVGEGNWCADYNWGDPAAPAEFSPMGFGYRNCTDWAAYRSKELTGIAVPHGAAMGHAYQWDDNAPTHGFQVDGIPEPGDIAQNNSGGLGHVGVVERVNTDDSGNSVSVVVSEYNKYLNGTYSLTTYNKGTDGIYRDGSVAWENFIDLNGTGVGANGETAKPGNVPFASIASQQEFYSDETGYVYTKAGGRAWPIKPRDQWTAEDTAHWGNEPVGPVGKDDVHNYEVGYDQNGYNNTAHPPAEGSRLYYDGGDGRQYFFYNGRGFHLASDAEAAGVGAKPLERVPLTENRMNPFLGQAANVPNETLYRIYGSNEVRFMSQTGSGFQSLAVPSEIYKECHIDFKGRKYVVLPSSAASRLQDSPLTISNSPAACAYPNDRVFTYDDTNIGPSGSVEQWRINGDGGSIPYTRRHYPLPLAVAYHTGNAPKYDTPNVPGDFRSLPLGPIMNLPNGIFLRNGSNLEVYRWDATSTGGSLRKVPSADTLKCLGNPAITDIRGDMMAGTPQGSLLACTYEGKILYVTAEQRQIIGGKARKIGNPAISACLQVRSKTGAPLQVSSSIFNSYTLDTKPAYCNYEQELGLNFVRETGDTQVYLVKAGGTKQRVGSLCADQTLKKYHVYEVPKGETAGHTTATNAWFASTATCNALPGDGTKA